MDICRVLYPMVKVFAYYTFAFAIGVKVNRPGYS